LLQTLPENSERDRLELDLQLGLGAAQQAMKGWADDEVGRTYARARGLCERLRATPQLFPTLWWLYHHHMYRADWLGRQELGEQLLNQGVRAGVPLLVAMGHLALGASLLQLGEFSAARPHLEYAVAAHEREQGRTEPFPVGPDRGASSLIGLSYVLWCLGYPDRALRRGEQALRLALGLGQPQTQVEALAHAGVWLRVECRELSIAQERLDRLFRVSAQEGLAPWREVAVILRVWLHTEEGRIDEKDVAPVVRSVSALQPYAADASPTWCLTRLAEAWGKTGRVEEGLRVLADALNVAEVTAERWYEAEQHRIRGGLLLMQGDESAAEASFHRAIEVARRQQARSWELRATTSLCRLWQEQGRREEARQALAEIYGWFTEGFDTGDLIEAKALLEELGGT
jgi:predicted ATPase